jgi:tetratricopeptide (TPR) repeat protein
MQHDPESHSSPDETVIAHGKEVLAMLRQLLATSGYGPVEQALIKGSTEELAAGLISISRAISLLIDEAGKTEEFSQLLRLLKAVAETINEPWALALYHHWQAKQDRAEGRLAEAIAHLEQAIEHGPDPRLRLDSIFELAGVFFHTGDLIKAEIWFQKLVEEAQQLANAQGMAYGYNGLADVALARGRLEEAKRWLAQAWQRSEKTDDLHLIAHILINQGIVHAQRGDLSQARAFYEQLETFLRKQAGQLTEEVQSRAWAALATNRATLALRERDIDNAPKFAAEALAGQASLIGREQIENLAIAGDILFFLKGDQAGKRSLLSAFRLAERMRHPGGLLLAGVRLTHVYILQGFYEPAHRVCASTIDAMERLRRQAGDEISRLQYMAHWTTLYNSMVVLCLLLTRLKHMSSYRRQALLYVEGAKSRTMIEALGRTISGISPANVSAELLQRERLLLDQLHALETGLRTSLEEAEQQRLQRDYSATQNKIDETWQHLAMLAPEYTALRQGQPTTFVEIQQLLGA